MTATTLTQDENDDLTVANDFRQIGIVIDPTTYGTSTVASATTARQTFVVKFASTSGTFESTRRLLNTLVQLESLLSMIVQEDYFIFNKKDLVTLEQIVPQVISPYSVVQM